MLEFEKIGLEDDNLGVDVDLDHGDEVGLFVNYTHAPPFSCFN